MNKKYANVCKKCTIFWVKETRELDSCSSIPSKNFTGRNDRKGCHSNRVKRSEGSDIRDRFFVALYLTQALYKNSLFFNCIFEFKVTG